MKYMRVTWEENPPLMVGWHEGHMACKNTTNPQRFSPGTGGKGGLEKEPADPGSPGKTVEK